MARKSKYDAGAPRSTGANLGFEEKLSQAADKLRSNMDAADYKEEQRNAKFRDRRRETLFIDARKIGHLVDRVHRELSEEEIARIAGIYHAWRGEVGAGQYSDVPGFCKSATTEEIASYGYVLTPGRYVGAADVEDDGEPFAEKMTRLTATLEEQFQESAKLEAAIRKNLQEPGFG